MLEQWRQKAKVGSNNTRQLEHSAHMRSGRVIKPGGLFVQLGQRLMKIGFDVRALKINVAALLEEGKFEDPLTVVQPGKKRPDNLGRGLVHAQHGSCSDLVMYLESKGCPKTRS